MRKPRLLDLFCGAGGAAMGYHRAGFEVVGVDIKPQPHYPFEFHQADALTYPLDGFDAYHASPPCQHYSVAVLCRKDGRERQDKHPDLLALTRDYLLNQSKPFVIENVPRSPMKNYIKLDGTMFDLKIIRERWFECHGFEPPLLHPCKWNARGLVKKGVFAGLIDHTDYPLEKNNTKDLLWGMSIDWKMSRDEVRSAIPPAYTEYIGKYLLQAVTPDEETQEE